MSLFLLFAFLLFMGSIFGWIFELFFRRFFTQKKWVNPGFLSGPYLPIYGFGLIVMFFISVLINKFISLPIIDGIVSILVIGISMTIIEYIGGLIFIKGMNIKLWDYSDRWGNIQGIICPTFSLLWTTFGAIYYYFINPYIKQTIYWLISNLEFCFFVGFFFGVLIIDFWNTLKISSKIRTLAKEKNVIIKFEKLKVNISNRKIAIKEKINFILPFSAIQNLKSEIENYLEKENIDYRINNLTNNKESIINTNTEIEINKDEKYNIINIKIDNK